MRVGEIISIGKGETVTCTRSARDGGAFEFELELAPGVSGPPVHHHTHPERVEVVEGEITFVIEGRPRLLRAGDRLEIAPGVAHTFFVEKSAARLHAHLGNGLGFERSIDQHRAGGPAFVRLARYLVEVDPHATYMVSPLVRAGLSVVAWWGRLRGVELVSD